MIKPKSDTKKVSQQELQIPRDEQDRGLTSSVDLYNLHVRKEGEKVLTQKEYNERQKKLSKLMEKRKVHKTSILSTKTTEYPLTPNESLDRSPNASIL